MRPRSAKIGTPAGNTWQVVAQGKSAHAHKRNGACPPKARREPGWRCQPIRIMFEHRDEGRSQGGAHRKRKLFMFRRSPEGVHPRLTCHEADPESRQRDSSAPRRCLLGRLALSCKPRTPGRGGSGEGNDAWRSRSGNGFVYDLRAYGDNAALRAALEAGEPVLCLFPLSFGRCPLRIRPPVARPGGGCHGALAKPYRTIWRSGGDRLHLFFEGAARGTGAARPSRSGCRSALTENRRYGPEREIDARLKKAH